MREKNLSEPSKQSKIFEGVGLDPNRSESIYFAHFEHNPPCSSLQLRGLRRWGPKKPFNPAPRAPRVSSGRRPCWQRAGCYLACVQACVSLPPHDLPQCNIVGADPTPWVRFARFGSSPKVCVPFETTLLALCRYKHGSAISGTCSSMS